MTQNHVFDAVVANLEDDIIYTAGETTFRFGGDYVTPGTFEFFGVPPFLGRALEPSDFQPGAPPAFVLRYATWVSQFQADPALIGKTFNLNVRPRPRHAKRSRIRLSLDLRRRFAGRPPR